jgi:imidazolonepropionase-like amidohydrolase
MPIVLRGGRVIAAGGREIFERGIVVVDGTVMAAVGDEREVPSPVGSPEIIDVKGRTISPGLIDAHAHVSSFTAAEAEAGITPRTVTEAVVRGVANLRRATLSGITTLRDLGCKHGGIFALRRATASGELLGPRLVCAGAAIAMTGGHGYDSVAEEADGPDGVRALTRRQLKLGADVIKVMASGGAGTPGERVVDGQLTVEEIAAAVDEAHKKGKVVASHAANVESVLASLRAGVDTIEHGLIMNEVCIDGLVENGRYYVPTLEIYERIVRYGTTVFARHQVEKSAQVVGPHREAFQMALKAGVKIAAGTDSGMQTWPLGDIALELERMVEFGMTPLSAIEAATHNAADALGMLDQIGTLEVGKLADLIVVDGNPLEDIGALRNVWLVMKGGTIQKAPTA